MFSTGPFSLKGVVGTSPGTGISFTAVAVAAVFPFIEKRASYQETDAAAAPFVRVASPCRPRA